MNYDDAEFNSLRQRAEAQGAMLLDKTCGLVEHDFVGPIAQPGAIAGCGNVSVFDVPYKSHVEGTATQKPREELHTLEICAVCDDMGAMDRFKEIA